MRTDLSMTKGLSKSPDTGKIIGYNPEAMDHTTLDPTRQSLHDDKGQEGISENNDARPGSDWAQLLKKKKEARREQQTLDAQAYQQIKVPATGVTPIPNHSLRLPNLRNFKYKIVVQPKKAVALKRFKANLGEAIRGHCRTSSRQDH